MIIDSHAHVVVPPESYKYMAELVASRANPAAAPKLTDEAVRTAGQSIVDIMDKVGTDIQFLSPRPYMQMHSVKPAKVTALWTRHMNDLVYRTVQMFPTRFRAVAGLPQYRDESPENCLAELEFRVKEQGFIGCLLNPDPTEGDASPPPGLGDAFWHPLYEKLCALDIPALIHSAGSCQPRESYTLKFINEESIAIVSLMNSDVFERFPDLKLIVPHGGGAIPYHMGRFRAWSVRRGGEFFDDQLKRLHFDTTTYDQDALELLFKVVGPDRVLFATENPGTGSAIDPKTGRAYDDLKPVIEAIPFLTEADRRNVFECNCTKLYSRFRRDA
ncbi:amidohydrolase family protein [Pseudorhodoferax sp. Leaf274]|uniref:amidohydrolase family protein n=1 Tax=Pseudorhodoferax sp. Leaf274 TaxID=1736318 RepID=UPI0007026CC3|nr:amidohydrolase family protein [Pseudorhodoferax sp. Leaf274]KQP36229.1 amidohydrolase [Pseudorhodoferax sp. Leaf274]